MATFEFEVFFDGDCPLCVREINMLRRLDRRGAIRFTDIAARDFDPATTGLTMAELMDRIHGRLPSGELVEGVEVFRRLYGAVGLGFLLAWTKWPLLRSLADWGYRTFAKNRLRLTGRCVKTDDGVCAIPAK
jgi:predicted DCC family thiol-disulfide oxidoreductase YuxK